MTLESSFLVAENNFGDSIKKIIVIGSTGTIGKAVSIFLLNSGFSVIGIGRKVPSFDKKKENYIHHILDLQNTELLEATLSKIVRNNEELSFLRSNDKGVISYDQSIENEMNEYCRLELMKYSDAIKFFSCG